MKQITHEYLVENGLILFESIVGSQAYGTQIPTSDIDKKFVYILPMDNILGLEYVEQLNVTKDYTGWEIKRFLELLGTNNPTVLELLNSPDDCIVTKHPLFDTILEKKEDFITKACKHSFGGYARQQIKKAKGLNKKQNWEKDKVVRKDLLDFCYVIKNEKTIPLKVWYVDLDIKKCGAVKIPNAKDLYAIYYDHSGERGYRGLVKEGGSENYGISNQLRLTSIPKGETPLCTITYNKDGYSEHCKDYREYQEWLNNRNETRYVETKKHGQKIDGKNMMHCIRLINMATDIGEGKGIQVRRNDREYLLSIRRGEVELDTLIDEADNSIKNMDEIFDNSNLPNNVDKNLVNELLISIRKQFYGL